MLADSYNTKLLFFFYKTRVTVEFANSFEAKFVLQVIATLFVISYSTPIFIAVIVPIGVIYYFIQRFYVATSRQLKRLESVSRSPIYSHFGESVTGASTIRAYGVEGRFIKESENRVDFNQVCYYPSIISNRCGIRYFINLFFFLSSSYDVLHIYFCC